VAEGAEEMRAERPAAPERDAFVGGHREEEAAPGAGLEGGVPAVAVALGQHDPHRPPAEPLLSA
jgi:hypothetical protein